MTVPSGKRLVLIGFSGLDWPGFATRVREGGLPRLAALAGKGVAMPLVVPPPLRGPAPWATIASGMLPEAHGVFRSEEAWAGGMRPAGQASWRAPAVWERLEAAGVATASIGWPATSPGADWAGLHIDHQYGVVTGRDWNDWALPPHCVPAALREELREKRVHPSELTGEALLPLVPGLAKLDAAEQARLPELAAMMARTASEQAAAMWVLGRGDWQAAFVHHGWLGEVRTRFERAPGGLAHAVDGAWRFLDGLAEALAEAAADTTVLIVGQGWRHDPGLLLAVGPGVVRGQAGATPTGLDLAPSVLAQFGLREAGLPGRVIESLAAGEELRDAPGMVREPADTDAALMEEVTAAGYALAAGPPPAWRAAGLAELAEAMVARDPAGARAAAREALALQPASVPALRALGSAAIALQDEEALLEIASAFDAVMPDTPWSKLAHAARHLLRGEKGQAAALLPGVEAAQDVETLLRGAAAWLMAGRPFEARRLFERVLAAAPGLAAAELGLSMAALAGRDFEGAEAALQRLLARDSGHVGAWMQLADLYDARGRKAEAERARATVARLGGG